MRYTLTITDKQTKQVWRVRHDPDLQVLLRVKAQHQNNWPGRYSYMITTPHMIQLPG
jgi:hypothetical protein